jgi:hypothetical protein
MAQHITFTDCVATPRTAMPPDGVKKQSEQMSR